MGTQKKPNVIIRGNGIIRNGGLFTMCGESGEAIEESVHIINSGKMVANDLSVSGNTRLENSGDFFSNKMRVGKISIENFAAHHPWYFSLIFTILGIIFDKLFSIFLPPPPI